MKTAIITLSNEGKVLADILAKAMPEVSVYLHSDITSSECANVKLFESTIKLTAQIFSKYESLIYIMPCGVVVRALDGHLKSKKTDPAVVVMDVGGRFAVSLLSGHEGGANTVAVNVANILGATPVVSTTTEAVKTLIIGIGCRKGANANDITRAINTALAEIGANIEEVRMLASADIKSEETGLLEAGKELNIPIRFISSEEIRNTRRDIQCSKFVQEKVNLPAVAEPAALLAGNRTEILLPRKVINHITVAIARERCLWSASDPAQSWTEPTAPKKP